jgi:hypothetical protein
MDTTFLNYLLLFSLLLILILYLYQSTPSLKKSNNEKNNKTNKSEAFFPIIYDTCQTGRDQGMPVHRVGPIHNFHQYFNKYSPNLTCKNPTSIPEKHTFCIRNYPTGIPELGWRNFYLANFNKNQVPDIDQFEGTSIRNFLNNLENVDNIYRKCL